MKYPRTYHLPWSLGVTDDDKVGNPDHFNGKNVVVMEKMDGENTTIYPDGRYHARSLDGTGYPWQAPMINEVLERLYTAQGSVLSPSERLCGENLYACHSIEYNELKAWFYAFSIWDDDVCLSHDDLLSRGFTTPKEFYRGPYDEQLIKDIANDLDLCKCEGYVVRNVEGFHYKDFSKNVMKFVRKEHVQTDVHWTKNWKPNKKL